MYGGRATTLAVATALALTALAGPASATTCRDSDSCGNGGGLGISVGVGLGRCDDLLKAVVDVQGRERDTRSRVDQDAADARAARKALEGAAPGDVDADRQRVIDADRRFERDKTEENRLLALIVKLQAGDCGHHSGTGTGCDRCQTTAPAPSPPVTVVPGSPAPPVTVIIPPQQPAPPVVIQSPVPAPPVQAPPGPVTEPAPPGPPTEVGTVPTGPVETGDGSLAGG